MDKLGFEQCIALTWIDVEEVEDGVDVGLPALVFLPVPDLSYRGPDKRVVLGGRRQRRSRSLSLGEGRHCAGMAESIELAVNWAHATHMMCQRRRGSGSGRRDVRAESATRR